MFINVSVRMKSTHIYLTNIDINISRNQAHFRKDICFKIEAAVKM